MMTVKVVQTKAMPRKTIIVEITSNTFTALEVVGGSGSPEILRWVSVSLPQDAISVDFIKEVWQKHKFSTTRV
ncbi:MAG TPA: hypothetical protein VEC37_13510, partial [Bacillota bacterium]|nr:hypothetical protein [Bacillota bacterium]